MKQVSYGGLSTAPLPSTKTDHAITTTAFSQGSQNPASCDPSEQV